MLRHAHAKAVHRHRRLEQLIGTIETRRRLILTAITAAIVGTGFGIGLALAGGLHAAAPAAIGLPLLQRASAR